MTFLVQKGEGEEKLGGLVFMTYRRLRQTYDTFRYHRNTGRNSPRQFPNICASYYGMVPQSHIDVLRRLYRQERWTVERIARFLRLARSTVHYWINKQNPTRYVRTPPKHDATKVTLRRRRLRVLVDKTDATGERTYCSARLLAAALFRLHQTKVSPDTVRRDLKSLGLVSRVRPVVTAYESDAVARLTFARRYLSLDPRVVLFSDEKIFDTNNHSHRLSWVVKGAKPPSRLVSRWPCRVHVWGVIGVGFRSLVILPEGCKLDKDAYIRRCLSKICKTTVEKGYYFLQDGAACHRAAIKYLTEKKVKMFDNYPARSPDFNMIETVWAKLQKDVWELRPSNRSELVAAVEKAWWALSEEYVTSLVLRWPQRLKTAIASKGRM